MASFERAYWGLERHPINDNSKELAADTLRSVALNYIQRKNPTTSQDAVDCNQTVKATEWYCYNQTR